MLFAAALTRNSRRRASITAEVAVLSPVLVAMMAFAVDGGMAFQEKRKAQAAADAAALAAATDLYTYYAYNNGYDSSGTALASAQTYIAANGYTVGNGTGALNGTNNASVKLPGQQPVQASTVITNSQGNIKPGYAEVVIVYYQPPYFSTIFTMWNGAAGGSMPIRARACARGTSLPSRVGMMALNPTALPSFWTSGNGGVIAKNGNNIIVDSTSAGDAQVQGTGAISATGGGNIYVSGPSVVGASWFSPAPILNSPPQPDPYASLPAPAIPTKSRTYTSGAVMYPGFYDQTEIQLTNNVVMRGEGALDSNGSIIQPGQAIYYFKPTGGQLQFSSGAYTISTQGGVMIYFDPNPSNVDPGFSLSSDTSLNLQPMAHGPYAGITFFQNRNATAKFEITGNGGISGSGTWYMPKAFATLTANGNMTVGNLIADTIYVSGNGSIIADMAQPQAPVRHIQLVE